MKKTVVLITGANGQIGKVLTSALRSKYGYENVIATDLTEAKHNGPFEILDITDKARMKEIIKQYEVDHIYHLAAILSSNGERNIHLTWEVNLESYLSMLDLACELKIDRIFFPSTIGVYGPTTPRVNTPQNTSFVPSTVYGISKLAGELWNQYYRKRYGLDIRSIRYPGVISYQSIPSGGTTDFAVEMFFEALEKGHYECFLRSDTRLPMVYMPDVIEGTLKLMSADKSDVSIACGYNLASFSLTPEELFYEIKKHIPDFTISYFPDQRQQIADSWSESIDDSLARKDWGWSPAYNMEQMVVDMIGHIKP
ncbi:MAG: NAD-dependent epimerase/dehydratase family protein [Saprospiraceae bacterium]|nr:NAD-dependent epimerase/dehydratase family protein [Saprospiraceae bacterium]